MQAYFEKNLLSLANNEIELFNIVLNFHSIKKLKSLTFAKLFQIVIDLKNLNHEKMNLFSDLKKPD